MQIRGMRWKNGVIPLTCGKAIYLVGEGGRRPTISLYRPRRNEQFRGSARKNPKNRKPRSWRTPPPVARVFCRHPVKPRPVTTSGIVLPCAPERRKNKPNKAKQRRALFQNALSVTNIEMVISIINIRRIILNNLIPTSLYAVNTIACEITFHL